MKKFKSYPSNSSVCLIKQLFAGLAYSYFNERFHLLQTFVTNNSLKIAVHANRESLEGFHLFFKAFSSYSFPLSLKTNA